MLHKAVEQFHNDYKKYSSPGSICGYLGVSPKPRGAIQNGYRSTLEGIVLVTDVLINVDDVVEDWGAAAAIYKKC